MVVQSADGSVQVEPEGRAADWCWSVGGGDSDRQPAWLCSAAAPHRLTANLIGGEPATQAAAVPGQQPPVWEFSPLTGGSHISLQKQRTVVLFWCNPGL